METCSVEVGLLKKKPCGEKAVSKCANCEIGLCAKHAVGQMSGGKKVFLCPECSRAWKAAGDIAPPSAAAPAAKAPAPAAAKGAPPPKPVAKPAAAAKPAAKEEKKEEPKVDDDAPLEFTPSKKPDEKK